MSKRLIFMGLLLITLSLCFTFQPFAQPISTPDPAQIFAEGIIVEPSNGQTASFIFDNLSSINSVDHVFRIRSSPEAEWQTFPFPPDFEDVACIIPRSNGTWVIAEHCYHGEQPAKIVILTPETGIYQPAELVCGDYPQALPDEGEWVIFKDETDNQDRLCFTETGEIRELPVVTLDNWYWSGVSQSPNREWLALLGYAGISQSSLTFYVYSYNLASQAAIDLGQISPVYLDNAAEFEMWVSDTQGSIALSDYYRSWPGTRFYAFDVTRENSVEEALYGWRDTLYIDETHQRYESFLDRDYISRQTGSQVSEEIHCQLMIYDAVGIQKYELGDTCAPVSPDGFTIQKALRVEDTYYYLARTESDQPFTELYLFNVTSRANFPVGIPRGEFETIFAVSPDQRYVVLGMDSNGQLDMPLECGLCPSQGGLQLVVYDMQEYEIVYLSEPLGVYTSDQVEWLDNHSLLLYAYEIFRTILNDIEHNGITMILPPTLRRITIGENGELDVHSRSDLVTPGEFSPGKISPDKHYLFVQRGVVDLSTFEYHSIIREDAPVEYQYGLNWNDASQIIVRVWREGETPVYYHVQFQPKDVSQ